MTIIVRMRHIREAGYCAAGARAWAHRHGFDWARFLREGIDAGALVGVPDAMAARVIERAQQEAGDGPRRAS